MRRQEEKIIPNERHSFGSYFTQDMVEIFHQLFKSSNQGSKNGKKQVRYLKTLSHPEILRF